MGKKAKKAKAKNAKEVYTMGKYGNYGGYGSYGSYYGGLGYDAAEPKKVAEVGKLEVWAGAWRSRKGVRFTHFLALNGEVPEPPIRIFGLTLPITWQEPKGVSVDWPDMGVPDELGKDFWQALADTLAKEEGILFVGCTGGIGRTGTALAILAGLWGLTKTPVAWVREKYRADAVETDAQVQYVADITGLKEPGVRGSHSATAYGAKVGGGITGGGYAIPASGYKDYRMNVADVLDWAFPPELKREDLRKEGLYAYGDGDAVVVEGIVGSLYVQYDGIWEVTAYQGSVMEVARSQLLRENIFIQRFIKQELAMLKLLEYVGIPPKPSMLDEYKLGEVEISKEGEYLYQGTPISLAQAGAIVKGWGGNEGE